MSAFRGDLPARSLTAIAMAAVAGVALNLGGWSWTTFAAVVALGVLLEWARLVLRFTQSAVAQIAWMVAGAAYIGLATLVLITLRADLFGMTPVLTVTATVIAVDIGAYFAGRTFQGPRIAPRISPSKTWAGLIGGMVGATLVLVLSQPFDLRILLMGPLVAVIAQTGDFFQSWMKRRAGVKDSGKLLPGHGGLFDRVDGLLAVLFAIGATGIVQRLASGA